MPKIQKMILVITVLFAGLIAGLLFSYSCSVNLGLHHLSDAEYVKTMQAINIEIQNFYFFTTRQLHQEVLRYWR